MKIVLVLLTLVSAPAFAAVEGEYRCKNKDGLPDNVYKITNVAFSNGGPVLPYAEIERNFRKDAASPLEQSRIRGFATEISHGNVTTIMIAALRLEFVDGKLFGCTK